MDAGDQDSVYCRLPILLGPVAYGDVVISAQYRPAWAPFWKKYKGARFVTVKTDSGKLKWEPVALSRP
jgi:hypothetical protein